MGRWRLRPRGVAVLGLLVLCLVAGAANWVIRSPFLSLRRVVVVGASSSIFSGTGLRKGIPLWTVNLEGTTTHLLRTTPWLQSATVSRVFPDELLIRATPRHAIALVTTTGGGIFGVDPFGIVLPEGAQGEASLPYLTGVVAPTKVYGRISSADGKSALTFLRDLPSGIRREASELAIEKGSIDLYLLDGTRVLVGGGTSLAVKARELDAILRDAAGKGLTVTQVDLTNPAAPTVMTPP